MKGKYLITTDAWFYAPDGQQYKCAWGEIEILNDGILGVKTNRLSSNWFAKIGNEENHVIVAGCQIHYAVRCKNKPNTEGLIPDHSTEGGELKQFHRPILIYIAE